MSKRFPIHQTSLSTWKRRRGAVVVLAALFLVFMVGCMAFAVDLGYLFVMRGQAQSCADAAALAAAWEMTTDQRVRQENSDVFAKATQKAIRYAALQDVSRSVHASGGDPFHGVVSEVLFGRLENPSNLAEPIAFPKPSECNTVLVRIACTPERGTPVPLFFARIFGRQTASVAAEAAAIFQDRNTVGFRVTDKTGPCSVMPFAVKLDDWRGFLAGGGNDQWAYDPSRKTVSRGADRIPELKIYPEREKGNQGKGKGSGITPGNFGTVDIGHHGNGAPDLWRQIREGPNADDLAAHGGSLELNPSTGTLELNGDTGMTASMKHALDDVVGMPRTILLYDAVRGQGNQTWFTIRGFAGVRVVDFSMTGQEKYILVQPAVVVDRTAISGKSGSSWYVGAPVHLVR